MDIRNLVSKNRTFTKDTGDGEAVTITYNPELITPALLSRIGATVSADTSGNPVAQFESPKQIAELLGQVVVSWDLSFDGEPLPPETDALVDLPMGGLAAIWSLIQEDITPPKAT